ncbi:hypothetical protein Tsp_10176, partial [Trichinella spiralis]
MSQEKQLSVS